MAGIFLSVLYSMDLFSLKVPVFAIHSSYLATKSFTVIRTNIAEEIIFLCFFAGFLLTAFSREQKENEAYHDLRSDSWHSAILINTALLILSTLFIFGRSFLAVLIINMFSVFIFYLILFYVKKWKFDRNTAIDSVKN